MDYVQYNTIQYSLFSMYVGHFLLVFDSGLMGFGKFWIMKRLLLYQTFIRNTCYFWYIVQCNPINADQNMDQKNLAVLLSYSQISWLEGCNNK